MRPAWREGLVAVDPFMFEFIAATAMHSRFQRYLASPHALRLSYKLPFREVHVYAIKF